MRAALEVAGACLFALAFAAGALVVGIALGMAVGR